MTGSAVRFDGGHKRMGFVMDELAQWLSFRSVCPEWRLAWADATPGQLAPDADGQRRNAAPLQQAAHDDITQKMADFTADYLPKIGDLSGLSPARNRQAAAWNACRLYDENGNRGLAEGVGLFTAAPA
uniref:Uncharacterized protein n=1 Tax=Citrobacter freundii TaxID=546 RepID=A0A7T8YYH8_CITFR|nr:hypothetical protein JJQ52_00020 [Citrobacter freundii]